MPNEERTITRTLRAALRLGDDYITIEESVTLPLDASDDDIQQAVALGERIYQAQRESLEGQMATLRENHPATSAPVPIRNPDAPASDNQRSYINRLVSDLGWSREDLGNYAREQGVDMLTMNKGQASSFIDTLKRVAEERGVLYQAQTSGQARQRGESPALSEEVPIMDRQYRALLQLARERGLSLDDETHQRFGVAAQELNSKQAGSLIVEWQSQQSQSG
jgi:hypothetical protein